MTAVWNEKMNISPSLYFPSGLILFLEWTNFKQLFMIYANSKFDGSPSVVVKQTSNFYTFA